MATREEMNAELKSSSVAFLRKKGFKGSFPNFYRDTCGFIALVNFQFFSSGGSFCVNLSYAGPNGENVYFKPDTPARKLSVSQTRSANDSARQRKIDGSRLARQAMGSTEARPKHQMLSPIW